MSLLYNVLFAWKTKNTHHKLALDALRHLQSPYADQWSNLFLKNIEPYLKGSKAPDKDFKDFRNHVLHVQDNYWGGAIKTALKWYKNTVDQLREENWKEAIYSAGVLSHYYTDPIQPFHTGQSDKEGTIHRAAEWSIAKSYEILQQILEEDLGGYPDVKVPDGSNWLSVMVKEGAELANPHYHYLVDHYDLKQGKRKPREGLDDGSRERLASLIGHASVGFSRILDKAFEEADVIPPRSNVSLHGVLASMTIPLFWVTKRMADSRERSIVTAIYNEIQETGQLVENLPEDDREIKNLYETEVLKKIAAKTESKHTKSKTNVEIPAKMKKPAVDSKPKPAPIKSAPLKSKIIARKAKQELVAKPSPQKESSPVSKQVSKPDKPVKPVTKVVQKTPVETKTKLVAKEKLRPVPSPEKKTVSTEKRLVIDECPVSENSKKPVPVKPAIDNQSVPMSRGKSDLKFYLDLNEPVVEAPSIGAKTAKRLKKMKILTVSDLLNANPDETAKKLNVWHIKPETVQNWQLQAELNCRIPNMRGHDVQILVACNFTTPEVLAEKDPQDLLDSITPFVESSDGQSVLRSCKEPDLEEVTNWINWSKQSRPLNKAA